MCPRSSHLSSITLLLLVEIIADVILDRVAVPRQEAAEDIQEDREGILTCRASEVGPVELPGARTHWRWPGGSIPQQSLPQSSPPAEC